MTRASNLSDQAKHLLAGVETSLGWWFDELATWFDGVVKQLGPMVGRTHLTARLHGDEIEIHEVKGEGQVALDKLTRTGERAETAPIQKPENRGGGVELFLDEGDVLSGEVELPSAAAANIRQALAFQLPRLLPLASEEIVFGATILDNDVAREKVVVGYAVARKDDIDRQGKALESKGYRIARLLATPKFRGAARQVELDFAGRGKLFGLAFFSHPLTGVAAIGAAFLLSFAIGQMRDAQVSSAATQSESARQQAGTAISLSQRAAALRTAAQEIAALRKAPMTGALLSDLAAYTPEDAFFDRVIVSEKDVRISGYALTAAAVLADLGHSAFLTNITFVTPVVVDAGTGKERFDIRADLVSPAVPPTEEAQP